MSDRIEAAASSNKAEENSSKLLADSGFLRDMSAKPNNEGKVFMCGGNGNLGGQFINGKDFDNLNNNLKKLMHNVADDVSKANNGAEIHVFGSLVSVYPGSFCSNGSVFPQEEKVGSGNLNGAPEVPNKENIQAQVKALTEQYKDSLQGGMGRFKELDITGGITITDNSRDHESVNIGDQRKVLKP